MREHPVPQQISSYEFRLVGDMTIKQFFQVAGGVVVSLIFYALPIPGFIKWPFVVFSAAFGAALAFFPINDRPLSAWVFAFFRAIYSPTHYVWVQNGAEDVFRGGSAEPAVVSTQGEEKAQAYLNSIPRADANPAIDEAEKSFLSKVTHLFQMPHVPLGMQANTATPSTSPASTTIAPTSSAPPVIVQEEPKPPVAPSSGDTIKTIPVAPVRVAGDANFTVSQGEANGFTKPQPVAEAYTPQSVTPMFTPQQGAQPSASVEATFTPEASPPSPATIPNTIVGQVLDATGKVIDSAILEIRDSAGRPVRAIRSNKVGHFITVTPLKDGDYELETEKVGFNFDIVRFKAEGKIIEPILIKAK